MSGDHQNAVAGPSSSPRIPLFPPPPPASPLPHQHLKSTQDLLSRFHLLPSYDKYVRSAPDPSTTTPVNPSDLPPTTPGGSALPHTPGSALDKGKGREMDTTPDGAGNSPMQTGVGADGDDDEDGKGEKRKKNSYKHLIKGVPGKHSFKKDDYLTNMMLVPPKQRMRINQFDLRTQKDAFTVSLEGLKGWNTNTLVLESAQAREDRKKRKELKRLAKAQQLGGDAMAIVHPQPVQAQPIPRPSAASTPRPAGLVGTPRPGSTVPRPGSAVPRPGSAAPRPSSTVPRPGSTSTVPRPGSTVPLQRPQIQTNTKVSTPLRTVTPTITTPVEIKGKKREREDGVSGVPNGVYGTNVNGMVNGNVASKGLKAGVGNIRPRPIKKQRMDIQGQARDVSTPVQQPTPQGV